MRREQEETERLAAVFLQHILHEEEIIERFRHFFRIDGDKTVVQPIMDEFFTRRALGLRNFIFVVRENEIAAAAVEIKRVAQIMPRHRRALDVPARPPRSPRTVPRRFSRFRRFPHGKVAGIPFLVIHFDPRTGQHILHFAPGKFPVIRKRGNIVVHVAGKHIRVAFFNERLHHRNDVVHVIRHARILVHTPHAERIDYFEIPLDVAVGNHFPRRTFRIRFVDNLVVHVREILNERHLVADVLQIAANHVPRHRRARVSDMRMVVRRHAADVNLHLPRRHRHEDRLFARHRIVHSDFFHKNPPQF